MKDENKKCCYRCKWWDTTLGQRIKLTGAQFDNIAPCVISIELKMQLADHICEIGAFEKVEK